MKKICMITTSDIDYDNRILNEAESLSRKYQVVILARQYSHGIIVKPKIFQIKRIDFKHLPIYKLNIFSSLFALMKAAWQTETDIYHAHDLDGLLCAMPAALLHRKTLIYDSHEVWSEIFPFSNLGALRWLFKPLEKFLMFKVKTGLTVNQVIANFLSKKYHKEFIAIYNTPKKDIQAKAPFSLRKKFPRKKIILQLGIVDEGRGLEQMIKAVKFLPQNYLVVFLGRGKLENQIKKMAEDLKLEKQVYVLPRVAPDEVVSTIKEVDLGLALTQKISLSYYYSSPNKLFQYIAAEVPILGSNFPEYKKIILQNNIGEVVNPANSKLIAQKIIKMLKPTAQKKYRRNLAGLSQAKYNWTIEEEKLLKFYRLLDSNRGNFTKVKL
ncbi:MAG: glycosyltransferase [Patescibacteria group bacterium]|nr:glycosyltransferase [Patescibacteria group bacterium]